jgi:hypothetical protein
LGSTLAAIGRDRPVVFDELMGAPVVLRHRDVSAALRTPATTCWAGSSGRTSTRAATAPTP